MIERRPLSPVKYSFLRKKLGTQAEVARLLGVRQSVVSKRERGLSAISLEASLALERLVTECAGKPQRVRVRLDAPNGRAAAKAAVRKRDADAVAKGQVQAVEIQKRNARFSGACGRSSDVRLRGGGAVCEDGVASDRGSRRYPQEYDQP